MIPVLESRREAIAALCDRYGVRRLDIFGSALHDDFRPGVSDLDFLVEFQPMESYARATAYFDLLDELRRLLGTEVDLVMASAVKNRYIARDIERTKRPLYASPRTSRTFLMRATRSRPHFAASTWRDTRASD